MDLLSGLPVLEFASGTEFGKSALPEQAFSLVNDPTVLVIGIVLIVATIIILFFLKKIIINTVLGLIIWGVATYILKVQLPLIPSFVVSAVFGPAGIGAMLLLKFLGLI